MSVLIAQLASDRVRIGRMDNRTRKKQLAKNSARARQLPAAFVRDTIRGQAEAKAGKLKRYQFTEEDRAWLNMRPVGREFDALRYLDSPESITAYLADIIEANNADLLEDALRTISPLIPRVAVAPIPLDLSSEAGRRLVLETAKRVMATHADVLAALARR